MKIMVVDDKEEGRYLEETLLKGIGEEVVTAANGREALTVLHTEKIDLIISDVLMPVMDGFELCRQCKADMSLKNIPFVFCTASYSDKKDEEFGLELGAAEYILKPFEPTDFIKTIKDVMERAKEGKISKIKPTLADNELFKMYNERLIIKLEQKVSELFAENARCTLIENELRISENNFRNFLDNSSIGIRIRNEDMSISYSNQAFLDIFGYKNTEESIAHPPQEYYSPESYTGFIQRRDKIARGETASNKLEVDIIRKDGTTRRLQIFGHQVIWNGKPQAQTFYNDVTELKQIQEALKTSEENFRNLINNTSMGIRISNTDGQTIYANQAFLDIFGYKDIDELSKSLPHEHYTPEEYVRFLVRKEKISRGEQVPDKFEVDIIRKDGTIRHVQAHVTSIFWNGKQQRQIIYNDITELKHMEEERQQYEAKAQIASRLAAVGEMAAGIAHEINNPLTGVIGFSQMLLEKKNLPEDIREDLKLIADGSQRVADIVKRLLTFARQTKPVKAMANLNELIENTLKLRNYVMKTANIEVVTRLDQELLWSVVDPGQMQQVFLTLIVNAEQAMKGAHGKGILTITTKKKRNRIHMSFQDDGPGITNENMAHMFQPFFTTKAPGEGTGLGLSLSRSIILEHDGTMSVESEPGHGATFIIELPIIESLPSEADALLPAAKAKSTANKKAKILVVDDEPGVRTLLEKVLTQSGHSVDTTDDASKALAKLGAGLTYDVILTDVRMPGMSGTEMYARIIEKMPAIKNRIIFITGDVMGADIKTFLTQNNLPSLSKPFDIKAVKEKIEIIMNAIQSENDNPDRSGK